MNENEQFLNRLLVLDNRVGGLPDYAVSRLSRGLSLEVDFKEIYYLNPFLNSIEILQLIWIKRMRNNRILKELRLLQTVGDICRDPIKYYRWLQYMLGQSNFAINCGRMTWSSDIEYSINTEEDTIDFSEIKLRIRGDGILVFVRGRYKGVLILNPELYVGNQVIEIQVDCNGKLFCYYLKLGKHGLYIDGALNRNRVWSNRGEYIPGKLSCGMDIYA